MFESKLAQYSVDSWVRVLGVPPVEVSKCSDRSERLEGSPSDTWKMERDEESSSKFCVVVVD